MPTSAMTMDLWMLVASAMLALVLVFPVLIGRTLTSGGLPWQLSNQDKTLEFPAWVKRAARAHANLVENLPTFVALVLVAHITGKAGDMAIMGTQVFFGARVLHAVIYIAGIPVVRTLVFVTSLVGEFMILANILS